MPEGLITSRQIQNVLTGIDVTVPEYQEIRGKMMSGHVEYQLIVVTRLSPFKSAKHKPEDVVQFAISKMYSELDEFYQKLTAQYPGAMLPPMPKKALFVGEADIRERRTAFDEIMRFISKDSSLATCPEFLDFLGAKSNQVADLPSNQQEEKEIKESEVFDFFSEKQTSDDIPHVISAKNKKIHCTTKKKEEKEEEEEEEEEAVDPLGIMRYKKPKKPAPSAKDVTPKFSLFEEADPDEELFLSVKDSLDIVSNKKKNTEDSFKLFEDPDLGGTVKLGDSLLLSTAYDSKFNVPAASLEEDTEDLFRVQDDFEKFLKLESNSKPKPKLPPKPPLPKKPEVAKRNKISAVEAPKQNVEAMDEVDILKYIQQNEAAASNSLDLFS